MVVKGNYPSDGQAISANISGKFGGRGAATPFQNLTIACLIFCLVLDL